MTELKRLYMSWFGVLPDEVLPLTGSASNRSYSRMTSSAGKCIGVVGTDCQENEAFIAISRQFREKGIAVPEVYVVSDDRMSYIQEDLGQTVLFDLYRAAEEDSEDMGEVKELLCRTMAALPTIQFEGAKDFDWTKCYPQPAFDRRMVMFDLNYFKYCFLKPSGLEFNEVELQDDFEKLADLLLENDTDTFLYRDFNARNVMVRDGQPYFIDFQGGRRGPIYYDVASFVYHARASYPDSLKEEMIDAYLTSLSTYMDISREQFFSRLRLFRLFRLLQVLGAYGFRGWTEHKANFITSIPSAIRSLETLLEQPFDLCPYLTDTLRRMVRQPRFKAGRKADGVLEVRVSSFSYKRGIPEDPTGNGGGYVFDCRSIHNPGRYEPYKKLTGRDIPVIQFLEEDGGILTFLEHVYAVVDAHVETFRKRGFTDLMVSFGCTGGQHRSVYCAEHLARHLAAKFKGIRVRLTHREQHIEELISC